MYLYLNISPTRTLVGLQTLNLTLTPILSPPMHRPINYFLKQNCYRTLERIIVSYIVISDTSVGYLINYNSVGLPSCVTDCHL